MPTIEITTRRRVEVPDDAVVFNEYWKGQGVDRVDATTTAKALLTEGETLSDAYVVAELVVGPDPDEAAGYFQAVLELETAKRDRDIRRLLGVTDLPTDEELYARIIIEEPTIVASCGNCGSTDFQYYEDVGYYANVAEVKVNDEGAVWMWFPSSSSSEGNGFPGLICNNCNCSLDEDNVEFEWG